MTRSRLAKAAVLISGLLDTKDRDALHARLATDVAHVGARTRGGTPMCNGRPQLRIGVKARLARWQQQCRLATVALCWRSSFYAEFRR